MYMNVHSFTVPLLGITVQCCVMTCVVGATGLPVSVVMTGHLLSRGLNQKSFQPAKTTASPKSAVSPKPAVSPKTTAPSNSPKRKPVSTCIILLILDTPTRVMLTQGTHVYH